MRRRSLATICMMLALALIASACAKAEKKAEEKGMEFESVTKGDRTSFFLAASGQQSDGKTIVIDEAVFTGTTGFVAIHADAGGAPGPVIGVSALLSGASTGVTITLDKPLEANATVWPMLHVDNGNGQYEFPTAGPDGKPLDGPAKVGDDVVVAPIEIELA